MRGINKVVLHCAFTPDSLKSKFSIHDIRRWHVEDNGWRDIGYHWYLTRDAIWHPGRPENIRGAHAGKVGNNNSLGLCYEGTWKPSQGQINAICQKYLQIKNKYGIGADRWFGHYHYKPGRNCPGFTMDLLRSLFKAIEGDFQF